MDKHQQVHDALARRFRWSNRTRKTLPWCASQRYTRFDLPHVYAELGYRVGAEIGVRRGAYSLALCKAIPDLHLVCIDPWAPDYKYSAERQNDFMAMAQERLKPYNVQFIRKTSIDALADVEDASLDFIFIDGDHHFDVVMMDLITWAPKVRSGGIISAHDCGPCEVGVDTAVRAYVHCHGINPWHISKETMPTAFWVQP